MTKGFCNLSLKDKKFNSTQSNSLNNLSKHLLRMEKEKDNLIDNSKTDKNEVLIEMTDETLFQSVKTFLLKNEITIPRKDSILAYQMVFSCDKKTFENPKLLEDWKNSTMEFIQKTPPFQDNCLLAVLHLDEAQPHLQAVFTPIDRKTNKLVFNKLLGGFQGGQKLSALHDEYAKYHEPLGFKRGDGTHTNGLEHKQYMKSIIELAKPIQNFETVEEKKFLGIITNKDEIIASKKKEIKHLSRQNKKLCFYSIQNQALKKVNLALKRKAKSSIENEKKIQELEQIQKQSIEKNQRFKQIFNENIELSAANEELKTKNNKLQNKLKILKTYITKIKTKNKIVEKAEVASDKIKII